MNIIGYDLIRRLKCCISSQSPVFEAQIVRKNRRTKEETVNWEWHIPDDARLGDYTAIIVGSIYFERWLEEKARRRKETETKRKTIIFIINDLENKL